MTPGPSASFAPRRAYSTLRGALFVSLWALATLSALAPLPVHALEAPAPLAYVLNGGLWIVLPGEAPRSVRLEAATSVGSPRFLDSSGESILFSAHRVEGIGTNRRGVNLRIADLYLSSPRGVSAITGNTDLAIGPDIHRDGRDIVYVSNYQARRSGQRSPLAGTELYRLRYPWRRPERLTDIGGTKSDPTWSPDGSRVAYLHSRGDTHGIYLLDLVTLQQTLLAPGSTQPTWRPDGKAIAFCRNGRLFEAELRDSTVTVERELFPGEPGLFVAFPRWTDYGLLFQWSRSRLEGISLLDPETEHVQVLLKGAERYGASDLAPRPR